MGNKTYIKEKTLDNIAKGVSYEILKILGQKLETQICKIEYKKGYGTGFFCNIPYDLNTIVKVLIANNHVLSQGDIEIGKIIKFSINNEKYNYEIIIDESRKIYTSEKYDITIIELKREDKLDNILFFDIDNEIFKGNLNNFKKKEIFLLYYQKGKGMTFSNGILKGIYEDNYTIQYFCKSSLGSSSGPIINQNYQVIGIHKGDGKKNYNFGILLKESIEKYNKQNNKNIKDEINNKYIKEKGEIKESNKVEYENINEIMIQYKIDNIKYCKHIRIFGDEFVKNNKDICKIIINGKEFELSTYFNVNIRQLKNNIFEIKLKGMKQITNISCLFMGKFFEYIPLLSLPDISKWNTKNVTDMNSMFYCCSSLSSLPDISKWNTQNVTNMSNMFYCCSSLSSLPDLSKWNTQSVTDMNSMFYRCSSISSLPDISKWNTQNVINMNSMFEGCSSLSSLPDISQWKTQNVTNMNSMFYCCSSLSSLPDISKWNTQNVTNMSYMFYRCSLLSLLPDISKWNSQNVTNMSYMFYYCPLLSSLPDISKWNTQNVTDMSYMFRICSSISSLPDISKWNTQNIINMSYMFDSCLSLSSLPNLSKWNTQNVIHKNHMLYDCLSLLIKK